DVFVPETRTFSVFTDAPREPGPLYRLPFEVLTELPVAAVACGIARHALDEFAALAAVKTPQGARLRLADDELARAAFARTHAARAWAAVGGRALAPAERAEITAACAHGVASLRTAVDELLSFSGMSGIEQDAALARAARDLRALTAHFSVGPRQLAAAGGA